ncbi:hypothetical protein COOONC_06741, partial [Cooperia oncophora]
LPSRKIFHSSDSLENILSDFDDALGASHGLKTSRAASREQGSRTLPREVDSTSSAKRIQNGYASDYTGGSAIERRSESATMLAPRPFALDFNAPPKPPHRSTPTGRSTPSRQSTSGDYQITLSNTVREGNRNPTQIYRRTTGIDRFQQ